MDDKKYYWIKLRTDFFNQDTIDFLMSQKNGAEYIVLYQMLCVNSANNNGNLYTKLGDMLIPYTVEKIVRDTRYFDFDTVTVALQLFKQLGLIYEKENNCFAISNFENWIGKEPDRTNAERQRRYRERQKQKRLEMQTENKENNANRNVTHNVTNVTKSNVEKEIDIEIEKEIEIDREEDIKTAEKSACPSPSDIINLFNDICKSYPKVRSLSEERKKAIKARLRTYGIDKIKEVFRKAENSSFLKGKNNRNWVATFDWLMKDGNFAKTLDGNYDDKKQQQQNYQQVYANGNSDPYEV